MALLAPLNCGFLLYEKLRKWGVTIRFSQSCGHVDKQKVKKTVAHLVESGSVGLWGPTFHWGVGEVSTSDLTSEY